MNDLKGKQILITGSARRIGRELAIAAANTGASIIIHHSNSPDDAEETATRIKDSGGKAKIIQADFSDPVSALKSFNSILAGNKNLYALVNNAAIFKPLKFLDTALDDWHRHMDVNLTMPFLLSQAFVKAVGPQSGKIINILDWRALRPGYDHFPYTIAKSGLAAMTKALALSLAPKIQVNGIALGAILPPSDGGNENNIISKVPAGRWANMDELIETYLFLLRGPEYITGEIIHLDGGRHLV